MARINADRRQPFRCQRMIEPHRQGPGLEHHPSGPRCAAADHLGDEPRIGAALAAPDPFAVAADRHRRFLHRHVQTYILSHLHPPVSSAQARAIARRPRDTIMIGRAAVGSTPAPTLSAAEPGSPVLCGPAPLHGRAASGAYVLAKQMGGDAPLMAELITLQTLAAFVTMPVVISSLQLL